MKTTLTTTGNLFKNTGILNHAGDYAGKYQQDAFDILNESGLGIEELSENEWCDIMHDNQGRCYAIYAEDALTCFNANCVFVKIEQSDCQRAYNESKTHVG